MTPTKTTPITQAQAGAIGYHFNAAAIARATQWDHERAIEIILGREVEISEAIVELAVNVRTELPVPTGVDTDPDLIEHINNYLAEKLTVTP